MRTELDLAIKILIQFLLQETSRFVLSLSEHVELVPSGSWNFNPADSEYIEQ